MRRRLALTPILVSLAVVGVLVAVYRHFYPTYEYRYRLTINIESDGAFHSGASIIDVTWYAHLLPGTVSFSRDLRGQAALVDLGSHGVVVATLFNGETMGPSRDGAWNATAIAPRAFGFSTLVEKLPEFLKVHGKRELAPNNLPRFLWFSNPHDPTTARKVLVQDFPSVIGPTVRFSSASVEIIDDPLVIDIRNKLPWLKALEQKPPGDDVIYLPDNFGISRALFIGAKS
jgi:hypothetical protein